MTRKANKPAVQGATVVKQVLESLGLIWLHMEAKARGQSVASWLHGQTGLSKGRISKGNLDTVRPSTLRKIEARQRELLKKETSDPETLILVDQQIATAPKTSSGNYAPWACWMHQLEVLPEISLPISKTVALAIDELLEVLLAACRDDDLTRFKQILRGHIEHHGIAVRIGEEPGARPVTASDLKELQALEDWSRAQVLTKRFADALYWDLIITLDAEWSSQYFSGRQCSPLFPLVMVRPKDGLLEGAERSSKNLFFRPSRRLLEFLYALVYYKRHGRWLDKPPSREKLADTFYRPGEQETLGPSDVSNYFDGSTKLTFDRVCEHWEQMVHRLMGERKVGPPIPMILLALHWQNVLVLDKGKSFLMVDLDEYRFLWRYRRQQWEVRRAGRKGLPFQASHKAEEPIQWPAWMLSQSSSSS